MAALYDHDYASAYNNPNDNNPTGPEEKQELCEYELNELNVDAFLDALDGEEDFLNEILHSVEEDDVPAEGEILCPACKKKFKTKSGLTRHKRKHENSNLPLNTFSKEKLLELLHEIKGAALTNMLYPSDFKENLAAVKFSNIDCLWSEVEDIYSAYYSSGNAEKFYSKMFSSVVVGADVALPDMDINVSTLVLKKLADELLVLRKSMLRDKSVIAEFSDEISDKELETLSHIGGYVLRTLSKKFKNSKRWRESSSQIAIAILEAGRADVNSKDETPEQTSFYTLLDRGNLWHITTESQCIFKIAEKCFRKKTCQKHLRNIDTESIVMLVMNDTDVRSSLNQMINRVDRVVDEEVAENILYNIVKLYVRVRSFSKARHIVEKHKHMSASKEKGGLRRGLKKADV